MPKLDANGIRIEYDTFGEPAADPLLLIMGLGTQMTAWHPEFCNALAVRGHYVIRFDNRDIGLSTKFDHAGGPGRLRLLMNHVMGLPVNPPYTLTDMAADAAGVLEALDIDAAHVVGASMGGMIAQLMALHHPDRVRSLTSFMSTSGDPALPGPDRKVVRHIFLRRPRRGDREAMLAHMTRSLALIGSPGYPRSDAEWRELVQASLERSYYPAGFLRHTAAVAADGSRVQRLKRIDRPTLVIHGRDDPLIPVEGGIDTARHIRDARLQIIDGLGHDIPPPLYDRLAGLIADHAAAARRFPADGRAIA